MKKPAILFYCQHALGMGHLIRSLALAQGLTERFAVTFLNGGKMPEGVKFSPEINVVHLPPLGFDQANQLISCDRRRSVDRAKQLRRQMIIETFAVTKPEMILIELFPFGRKKFADELLPLLEMAKSQAMKRPLVVCSLRDLLVGKRRDQQRHNERAVEIANRFFDAILVHTDPAFARLEDSLPNAIHLQPTIHYTGFVQIEKNVRVKMAKQSGRKIVVSAGGGMVGFGLFNTAIESYQRLPKNLGIELKLIAGPFLPEAEFRSLSNKIRGRKGIQLVHVVKDLTAELGAADASISQCGYNTALDILRSRVSALVVPFANGLEDEQMNRARRLEKMGALQVLDQNDLSAERLAEAMVELLNFKPHPLNLNLQGVKTTAHLLDSLIRQSSDKCRQLPLPKAQFNSEVRL
ncbi:MAG: glycosyltransferase [Acidobacteriota bacterium]